MAEHAGARFYEGLRVTADHLRHMQDSLWEAVGDLRLALGRGRIAWGLRAQVQGPTLRISPGVAFSPEGVRLALDTEVTLDLGTAPLPARLLLTPVNEDRASLQMDGIPTFVTLRATATLSSEAGPPPAEALAIAEVSDASEVTQDPALFIATGHHSHTGGFVQDTAGRWYFDGPALPQVQALADQLTGLEALLAALDGRLTPLETLPADLAALQSTVATQADLAPITEQLNDLQAVLTMLAELTQLVQIGPELQALAGISAQLLQVPALLGQVSALQSSVTNLATPLTELENRLSKLETSAGNTDGGGSDTSVGFDPTWPRVQATNWPHAQILDPEAAAGLLRDVVFGFSQPMTPDNVTEPAQTVQVWFEPVPQGTGTRSAVVVAQPILTLAGSVKPASDTLRWSAAGSSDQLLDLFKTGGRLMVRLHCGMLLAEDGRAYSASAEALIGKSVPPVPGGVLETWVMVTGG